MESKKIKLITLIQIVLVVVCLVWIVFGVGGDRVGVPMDDQVILNK